MATLDSRSDSIKPDHFMRFPGGDLRLVDFGCVVRTRDSAPLALCTCICACMAALLYTGCSHPPWMCACLSQQVAAESWATPGHSRRYCAPEVARNVLRAADGGVSQMRVQPSTDMWAVGLVLYELFMGTPIFPESISYREIADSGNLSLPREATDELIGEAHGRLLSAVLLKDPSKRPSAQDLLNKNVFKRADDTAERRRIEIVAFFCEPVSAEGAQTCMCHVRPCRRESTLAHPPTIPIPALATGGRIPA